MTYVSPNFRSDSHLKKALAANEPVEVLGTIPENGTVDLEGPHWPEPSKWYATGIVEGGKLVRLI